MDIIDRNRIRNHPAAVLARRAAERRQAKPAPVQPKAPTTRAELEAAITAAFAAKFPTYPLYHSLIKFYGCLHLWQLSERQLREFRDRINAA
jgi:hypothetical protein